MRYVVIIGTPWRSGGNYVLHFISQALRELGHNACIHPIDQPAVDYWKSHHTSTILAEHEINKDDVLIVPEEFIFMIAQLANRTVRYVIINQGFFASFNSNFGKKNNYITNCHMYNNAITIMCNSEHTQRSVGNWFEVPESKMMRYVVHIEKFFLPNPKKEKKITYMSRKNYHFCMFVVNYLEGRYRDWVFEDISNLPYEQVAETMATSKIFLSFGGPEGLGMPPIEAALTGNKVIGFHGYGGMEYFHEPIFTDVPYGNHYAFLLKTTEQLPLWEDKSIMDNEDCLVQMDHLRNYYSRDNALQCLVEMDRRVNG